MDENQQKYVVAAICQTCEKKECQPEKNIKYIIAFLFLRTNGSDLGICLNEQGSQIGLESVYFLIERCGFKMKMKHNNGSYF